MTVDEIETEIRRRFKAAQENMKEVKRIAPESFGGGFALGYHDALGELLEFITEN